MRKRAFLSLAGAIASVALIAPPSTAVTTAPDPSQDGAIATTSYTQDEGGLAPTAVDGGMTALAVSASTGCKIITGKLTGKNIFGDTQFTFKQTAQWCWNGSSVTYKYSDYTVSSPGQFWDFKRLIDNQQNVGRNPWIRFREGYFAQCIPTPIGSACGNKAYPWLRMRMYGNGSYSIEHGIG